MRVRRITWILILVAVAAIAAGRFGKIVIPVTDFCSFWIAGHRLLHRLNPYDAAYALQVERALGFAEAKPLVMRNPPLALWATLPLGMLDYASAWIFWTCCLILSLAISARLLWAMYGGSQQQRWVALAVTFGFAPALACLTVGQTAPFVLLGLTFFLYLQDRHEFWSGFVLLLAAFKPQLAFLFWITLALWCVYRQKWKQMAGVIVGIASAMLIVLCFDGRVAGEYWSMLRGESLATQFIPTFGGLLRQRFGYAWLQVLPAIAGVVWTVVHYVRHRHSWSWKEQLPILLLASMLLTPYAWLVDEPVILLPLVGASAALATTRRGTKLLVLFAIVNAGIVIALALGVRVVSPYYTWTIWVWIVFYAAAYMQCKRSSGPT